MSTYDFSKGCKACGGWCCQGENPFTDENEACFLGLGSLTSKEDGSCILQDRQGACAQYSLRPFECRIFPLDVKLIGGRYHWIVWDICPLVPLLDIEGLVEEFEHSLLPAYPDDYIQRYVDYHKTDQPPKYASLEYRVLSPVELGQPR